MMSISTVDVNHRNLIKKRLVYVCLLFFATLLYSLVRLDRPISLVHRLTLPCVNRRVPVLLAQANSKKAPYLILSAKVEDSCRVLKFCHLA